jgi:hypothetical protein
VCVVLLGTLAAPIAAAAAATPAGGVPPPATINSTCTADVSQPLQNWLGSLPTGTTVTVPAGACYLINEGIKLSGAAGLTISGGMWKDAAVAQSGAAPSALNPVIWLVGGTDIALENMTITGVNPGGYTPAGAFVAGIRSDGVVGLDISGVSVNNVYGDGIELAPLRAANDLSSTILNATKDVTINDVNIVGAGRQGITLASVNGAQISSVRLAHIGLDVFDLEADQWDEGARNVTINGCTSGAGNGGLFFANAGSGGGAPWTEGVTVENCTMDAQQAGDAVLIETPTNQPARGAFTFTDDTLRCGASVYVACVEVTGGNVSVNQSTLLLPPGTVHEDAYYASNGSTVTLNGDTVTGYGTAGTADQSSAVHILGGAWSAFEPPVSTVSHPPAVPASHTSSPALTPSTAAVAPASHASASQPVSAASTTKTLPDVSTATGSGSAAASPVTRSASGTASASDLGLAPSADASSSVVALRALLLLIVAGCAFALALALRRRRRVAPVATASIRSLLERPFGA